MQAIVAVDDEWGIGCGGDLLVRIPDDMRWFKEHTVGKTVIMGNCTFKSLPDSSPLKDRVNIILSHDRDLKVPGAIVLNSMDEVLDIIHTTGADDSIIIGGQTIYEQFLPYCDTAYVTRMHIPESIRRPPDRFFPNLDGSDVWDLVESSGPRSYQGVRFWFAEYRNRRCQKIDRLSFPFIQKDECTFPIPSRIDPWRLDDFIVELLDTLYSYMRPIQDGMDPNDVREYENYADCMDFIQYLQFKRYISTEESFEELFFKYCISEGSDCGGYTMTLNYRDLEEFKDTFYSVACIDELKPYYRMTPVSLQRRTYGLEAAHR